jgi:hypothetical protein
VTKAQDFQHMAGEDLTYQAPESLPAVVQTALQLLGRDVRNVLGDTLVQVSDRAQINLRFAAPDRDPLAQKKQAFRVSVYEGRIYVTGSDPHGLAYGVLEISRLLGVSPWEWWADVTPHRRASFELPASFVTIQSPSVEYRGIFINDEDWGMMPWSSQTYEPGGGKGVIGPKTHARIFELMLRLRANLFWPAMHECTQPFFLTKGNREMAAKYGIYIGGSHCEPMACSTAGEWPRRGVGAYDYVNNAQKVKEFWSARLDEVKEQPIVYTLGMRGVHDGKMQGAKTLEEQRSVLKRVIGEQRLMLQEKVNEDLTQVPQVFIPYKEVQDIYDSGLEVPEDVCLMWCDDNYGYIKHFPTAEERNRKGGNGLYYHVSYWGRPHDYLWLATFCPNLLRQQLTTAYRQGIQRMWVLNVGDIKPAEYQIELFCDLAWNVQRVEEMGIHKHLHDFMVREFGTECGPDLAPVMERAYRLAFACKPEFLGHTRTEEKDPKTKIVSDMPWSEKYIRNRLKEYANLSQQVQVVRNRIDPDRLSAYFQLVQYPIQAADQMNRKMLIGQLARHGRAKWSKSDAAYDSIFSLTELYNKGLDGRGKWKGIMDCQPRRLGVFLPLQHRMDSVPMVQEEHVVYEWKSTGLWTELPLSEGAIVGDFRCAGHDSMCVIVKMLPTHPLDNQNLRYEVTFDNLPPQVFSIRTQGRSEEWKQNVLTNASVRKMVVPCNRKKKHRLSVKPLDEGLCIEEIVVIKVK